MGTVSENIKKCYSNTICIQCDNDICKVYGGRCKKYLRKQRWDNFIGWLNKNKV